MNKSRLITAIAAMPDRDPRLKTLAAALSQGAAVAGPDRLIRRADAAARLGRTQRFIDRLAADGILTRVRIPGRKRACGFRESEVMALIEGTTE